MERLSLIVMFSIAGLFLAGAASLVPVTAAFATAHPGVTGVICGFLVVGLVDGMASFASRFSLGERA